MSDWMPKITLPGGAASRHLRILRDVLGRDYFSTPDWQFAQADLARMLKTSLEADHALVAIWNPSASTWSAIADDGTSLTDGEIGDRASRTVLEHVRRTGEPLLTAGETELPIDSASIRKHDVDSVIAAPLFFWERADDEVSKQLGAVLYAHRSGRTGAFTEEDVEIGVDIARIAQPTLNVLRQLDTVERDLEASQMQLEDLRRSRAEVYKLGEYATRDQWFGQNVIEPLRRVASARKISILLLGPTGAGKTFLAEAFHHECSRRRKPFVILDCAQVTSSETLAAELFGFAPNSGYVNAPRGGRPGKALLADGGTLFVDEIGTLPADLQQRLLRLLENGTFTPLGSSETKTVDIQVIVATNENLAELVQRGAFREDLFWRLSDVTIELPSLEDRPGDIPVLAEKFLRGGTERAGRDTITGFTDDAMAALIAHPWSRAGNIRGLERTILRSVLMAPRGTRELEAAHLSLQELGIPAAASQPARGAPAMATPDPMGQPRGRHRYSKKLQAVIDAIQRTRYATAAAQELGMSYRQLTWQLHKVGLSVRDVLAWDD
jgi:transcriptional regulator with GAF, ATPase, and Fis domain